MRWTQATANGEHAPVRYLKCLSLHGIEGKRDKITMTVMKVGHVRVGGREV